MVGELERRHPVIRRIVEGKPKDRPLIGVAPGSGQITRTACQAGADLLFTFSAGVYRTTGVGSLASFLANGNANDQTERLLLEQILPHAGDTPVVAGLMPGDPLRSVEERLERLRSLGIGAVTNWPATGLVDGSMRRIMAREGLSHETERQMLSVAKEMGFAVFGFALDAAEVRSFCEVGVDGLILNVGLTRAVKDSLEKKNQIRTEIATAREMWRAREGYTPEPLCFLFGGSIIQPIDLEEILRELPIHGYAGGSAFERIPVQAIVDSTVRRLKGVLRPTAEGEIDTLPDRPNLVGSSRQMAEIYNLIDRVAPHDVNVLIEGETGTGKELVAHYLHRESPRREMPFVTMNCGAIPDSLVESEFFGYEKGAFTGAHDRRRGKFELANHGVLFLDEIGDLSRHGQVSLLRVIQQGEIFRIGGQSPIRVDVRILAATNRDLQEEVRQGNFRSDLYYRISPMVIHTPPLRRRPSDIPGLVRYFLELLSTRLDRKLIGVTESFMKRLMDYAWPGNVRELEHVLTRAALLEDSAILEGRDHSLFSESPVDETGKNNPERRESKALLAHRTLERCGHNKSRAASELGISRKTLYNWLRQTP
ncbi:MAG: sigma 54-interacting transcriptional regulator [Alkalispirochaetaceae bacterium]